MRQDKKKMNPVLKAYAVSTVVFGIILVVVIFIKIASWGC